VQVPAFAALPKQPLCAVNLAHVLPAHSLRDGDEVAILPPLAGG
jgi:molybdopterin converting factor small subunit